MKEVKCDNCGRKLFNTNRTSLGAIAAEATTKRFVAKKFRCSMALVNLKSFAIKNVASLGFNLILARKIETKEIRLLKKFSTIRPNKN